ncbi:DUF3769 domain-containing protein [uncultured Prochlorococcus sp.]|uniref:DUF3769 domain-containing protein n=1 Tax=uncultured Prochlorococcus sp. TaxID=159733 RepID=UPI00258AB94C|nr:DUF3769 domain-containing protein [uncultured Prochlorococcus sp.]
MRIIRFPLICFFIIASSQKVFAEFSNYGKVSSFNNKIVSDSSNVKENKSYIQNELRKFINFVDLEIANNGNNPNDQIIGLEIISDTKLTTEDLFLAKGNVIARTNSIVLNSDQFEYNSKSNILIIRGNIKLKTQDQFLLASEIKYDTKNKQGYILDAYGSINFDTLNSIKIDNVDDRNLKSRVDFNDKDKSINNVILNNSNNLKFSKQKVKLELNNMQKWRFETTKIEIDNDRWFSEELLLTNDPYNYPQVVIKNKNFESLNKNDQITIKTKWSTLILDKKLKIPTGPRRIKLGELQNLKWGVGYDQNSKDGLYITRNSNPIYFGNDKAELNLKKEFYLQRALLGHTKSFTKQDSSLYTPKIKQNSKFSDLFGISGKLSSKIFGFDFDSEFEINSLDINKFNNIFRAKNTLEKVLFSEDKKDFSKETKLTFFTNYNENIWNGSLGEREILSASGIRIGKKNNTSNNNVNKSSVMAFGYGTYQSNKNGIGTENIIRDRLNILLEKNLSYPLWKEKEKKNISQDYIYTPEIIQKSIYLNMTAKVDLYRYNDDNFQDLYTFKIGPEVTLGNFKRKYFDFTKFSIYPKLTLAEGKSPFDFDQAVDNHAVELTLKQQLIGPLALKVKSDYNLDVNSKKYQKFTNTIYEIDLNRRAYNISLFYNQQNKTGGINFKIYSFNFDGYGDRFK